MRRVGDCNTARLGQQRHKTITSQARRRYGRSEYNERQQFVEDDHPCPFDKTLRTAK